MINAVFKKNNGNIVSVNLNGHAESTDEGYDLVCSAVSAVSLTIANGITEVVKVKPNLSLEDGFLSMDFRSLPEEDVLNCQILLKTLFIGLQSIEVSYGDYISIKVEEV
ncbi:ribosomal-processing cysteine protease Prp [Clostridium sp. SYSU_GA19001]|uniref:ribosomal-processing cysteine protease Prp n=1 Tax=Clostridium caldaquaticum TaxID=2940653 RepID=UPI002077394F|nr:ribosomal-processing cysteine protease Prp [Clostridium caldaquaticum]MCM8710380.1 ribosomal-processing cysteine protease Prp [Clostridium caldaquaticum]